MKNLSCTSKRILGLFTAGLFLLSACYTDPISSHSSSSTKTMIEGRVEGDPILAKRATSTTGIEGATVKVVRVKADGSLETVAGGDLKTDVTGHFFLECASDSLRGLIVVADKEGKEWKTVISSEVKEGEMVRVRPLNMESSVEADIYTQIRSRSEGDKVPLIDITSQIDGNVAAKAYGNGEMISFLATQMEINANIRGTVLIGSSGKFTQAQLDQAEKARWEAQAKWDADLDTATAPEGIVKGEDNCRRSQWKAFADAGISLGEYVKAREVAYHAMIEATSQATITGDTRMVWMRALALQQATHLEAAFKEETEVAGNTTIIGLEASQALQASLIKAQNQTDLDSAFSLYRQSIAGSIKNWLQISFGGKVMLSDTSKARIELKLALTSATTPEKVSAAYQKFYSSAELEIKNNLLNSGLDSTHIQALTGTAILAGVQVGFTSNVNVTNNFSLAGKVENNLSGADVQLATVKLDGSLDILSNLKTKTDASGSFVLNTTVSLPESLVVLVTKDSAQWMTLVNSKDTSKIKVNSVSTVEAQIYQQTVKRGETSSVTPQQIKAQVDSLVAVSVKGNDSAIVSLILSMDIANRAQTKFLLDSSIGLSASSLVLISKASSDAEMKLQADIKAAVVSAGSSN